MIILQMDSIRNSPFAEVDTKWIISAIVIPILVLIFTLLSNKKWQKKLIILLTRTPKKNIPHKSLQVEELAKREHAKLTDNKGLLEIDLYWGERISAYDEMREGLKQIKNDIFISGIALRTISKILIENEVLNHFKNKIEKTHSSFNINIIACDTIESAKRPEQEELETNLKEGKELLNKFKKALDSKISPEIKIKRSKEPYLTINTYPSNIAPRHFIAKLDEFIYVGSYLNIKEGHKSYIMRLKEFEDPNGAEKKHTGLYNLFKAEITYLERNCKEEFVFNN